MGFQVSEEIESSTLIGCGSIVLEQGSQTPFGPVPRLTSTSSMPTFDTLVQDQILLKGQIFELKQVLVEEKGSQCKVHEDLLSAISALRAKFTSLFSFF